MIIYSDKFLLHDKPDHPENKQRLIAIIDALKKDSDLSHKIKNKIKEPKPAKEEHILAVHDKDYFNLIKSTKSMRSNTKNFFMLDQDTYLTDKTYECAVLAAGAVEQGVDLVYKDRKEPVFCLVRPPGHHAPYGGFCIFNNIAIAAMHALKKYEKVFILDIDVHHGNGTQNTFYQSNKVFYCSLHQYPFYPGTGSTEEVGTGPGKGYTLNIPLSAGTDDETYMRLFQSTLSTLKKFNPDVVLVSLGLDSHKDDTLGGLALTDQAYKKMTKDLLGLEKPLVFVLEGGYNLDVLGRVISKMMLLSL